MSFIHSFIRAVFSKDISKMDEIRRREAQQIKNNDEVAANDAYNEAMRQQRLEEAAMPIELEDTLPFFLRRPHERLQGLLSRCQGISQEYIHNQLGKLTTTVNTRFDELLLEII